MKCEIFSVDREGIVNYFFWCDFVIFEVNEFDSVECFVNFFCDCLYFIVRRWWNCFVFNVYDRKVDYGYFRNCFYCLV